MKKKLLSIICILALVFTSVVPASAMEIPVNSVPTPVMADVLHINPIYEDIIDEEALRMELAEASQYAVQPLEDITYYADEAELAAALRQAMVERQESVTLGFAHSTNYTQEIHDRVVDLALAETNSPKEGDYLAFQYGGCGARSGGYIQNDMYYLTIVFSVSYYTTAEQEQAMDAAVEQVLDELNLTWTMSDYDKVCSIYDYICNHVTYDHAHLNDESYKLQFTAYAALVQGTAVCQGYANLFYRLAKEAGLSTRIVRGWQTSSGGGHAWNIVKLGDWYYNLDATWDTSWVEAGLPYAFFLKGWDTYEDHSFDTVYMVAPFITEYPMSTEDYVPGSTGDGPKDISQGHAYLVEDTFVYKSNNHTPEVIVEGLEFGIDYEVEYLNNLEAGQATAIVRGIGNYCGEIMLPFTIEKLDISGMAADAVLSQESFTYSGEPFEPTVMLDPLMQDMDYTVSYENNENAGTATAVITGCGSCQGAFRKNFVIRKADMADIIVTLDQDYYHYTGTPVQPQVDAGVLVEGKDFELSYSGNDGVGTGVVTLTGKGNYTGTVSVSFEIRNCEHDWDGGTVTKTPNCQETGQQVFICSICQSERVEVLATNDNHRMSTWQTETPATCSKAGLEYRVCDNGCGKREENILAATGRHTYGVWIETEPAACEKPGKEERTCSGCDAKEEKPTAALEHDIIIDQAVAATCVKTGLKEGQHCSRCDGATVVQTVVGIDSENHKMGPWQTETPATCGEDGLEYRVCENGCGERETNTLQSTGQHTFGAWVETEPAACEKPGKEERKCSGCDAKEEQPTAALKHDIIIDKAVAATCVKTGLTEGQHCSRCDGATVVQKVIGIDADNHTEETNVVKATRTSAGSIVTACTACKETVKSEVIPAIKTVALSYKQKVYTGKSVAAPELTVTDAEGNKITSYDVNGLTAKTAVDRYKVTVNFKGNYEGSADLYFTIVPKKVSSVTVNLNSADQNNGYNDIKATWKKSTGATGYLVYYKKASGSKWSSPVATTKTSYTKKNLAAGTKYTFKVVPYYKESGKTTKYYDANQYKSASTTTLKKVTGVKVVKSGTKVKVSWTNINGETGYQISKMTKKSATQKTPTTVKSATAKSKLITATKGKTYYYKVRAYKVVDGKKVYGPWSDVKSFKRK